MNEEKEEFKKKCTDSFAKRGFLTTDLVGDWALDRECIESFHHSRSLKLLEDIRHEFIALTTKDFVILLDEAINLYRK